MTNNMESDLRKILEDPKNKKIARSGMNILQIIKHLTEKDIEPNPGNITLEYYGKESKQKSNDQIPEFIRKRRSVVSRKLSKLVKTGLIMPLDSTKRSDKRSKPYQLTLLGLELVTNEKLYLSLMESKIDQGIRSNTKESEVDMDQIRKYHSDRIRSLLIRMRDELSKIFEMDFLPASDSHAMVKYKAHNLAFEEDPLFEDLENHLKTHVTFNALQEQITEMKDTTYNYFEKNTMVRRIVISEISRELDLAYSNNLDEPDSFHPNLIDWVSRNLYYLYANKDDLYMRYARDIHSEKEKVDIGNQKMKRIRVDGAVVMVLSLTKKESYYLVKLSNMMGNILNTPILEQYRDMMKELEHAKDIQTNLIHDLDKEIDVIIYPGECPYITSE